jgi:hypothetical protein
MVKSFLATDPEAASGQTTHRPAQGRRLPEDVGDLPYRIDYDGTWLFRGAPILRNELVSLLAGVLKREADGSFWLETPNERGRIEVDDAPFVAVAFDKVGDGLDQMLSFRTNLNQVVTLGPDNPLRVALDSYGDPTRYLLIRPGIEARIDPDVYRNVRELFGEPACVGGRPILGLWSSGAFFQLGEIRSLLSAHGEETEVDGALYQRLRAEVYRLMRAPADEDSSTDVEDAGQAFLEASRATLKTADDALASAIQGNDEIGAMNQRIDAKLAEINARQSNW